MVASITKDDLDGKQVRAVKRLPFVSRGGKGIRSILESIKLTFQRGASSLGLLPWKASQER